MGGNKERRNTNSDPLFNNVDTSVLEDLLDDAEKLIEEFSAFKKRLRNVLDGRRQKKKPIA